MTPEATSAAALSTLLHVRDGLIVHQALYAAAKLGVADLLKDGPQATTELAAQLQVNELALHRVLRALASRGIFEETSPRIFSNNASSSYLRAGVPGSVRSVVISGEPRPITVPSGKFSTAFKLVSPLDPSCWGWMAGSTCSRS